MVDAFYSKLDQYKRAYVFELLTRLNLNQNVPHPFLYIVHFVHVLKLYMYPFEFPGRSCKTVPHIVRSFSLRSSCGRRAKKPYSIPHSHSRNREPANRLSMKIVHRLLKIKLSYLSYLMKSWSSWDILC